MAERWQDMPLAATGDLDDAVDSVLRYLDDVDQGRRERVNQVPLEMDPATLRRKDPGGLTTWRGVLPVLPHVALLACAVFVFGGRGLGHMAFDGVQVVGELFVPLIDLGERLFGWTSRFAWWHGELALPVLEIDLASWSPWAGALLTALVFALLVGPTRATLNQALVQLDKLRRHYRGPGAGTQ